MEHTACPYPLPLAGPSRAQGPAYIRPERAGDLGDVGDGADEEARAAERNDARGPAAAGGGDVARVARGGVVQEESRDARNVTRDT